MQDNARVSLWRVTPTNADVVERIESLRRRCVETSSNCVKSNKRSLLV
jgi:hypothetical protein